MSERPTDIALVSLGTTPGLRRADDALAESIRAAGLSCDVLPVAIGVSGRLRRHPAVTDLVEAIAAARTGRRARARAIVYSTVTAALLQRPSVPYAVRFDAPAALNRPGAAGAWQRRAERRALGRADVLLPWGEAAAQAARALSPHTPVVALPVALERGESAARRDLAAVAYAGYPRKRGLELLAEAWARAAHPGERLLIGGLDRERGLRWLERFGSGEPAGVEWAGALPRSEWLATVARAKVFVNASRWEDHGLAQLEALDLGLALVTAPSPGAYEALGLARQLAPALVSQDGSATSLARALRAGLDLPAGALARYGARAAELLAPYREERVAHTLVTQVLPRLGLR